MYKKALIIAFALISPVHTAQHTFEKPRQCHLITNELTVDLRMHEKEVCEVSVPDELAAAVAIVEKNGEVIVTQNNGPLTTNIKAITVTLHPLQVLHAYLSGDATLNIHEGQFSLDAVLHNGGLVKVESTQLGKSIFSILGKGTLNLGTTSVRGIQLLIDGAGDVIIDDRDGGISAPGHMSMRNGGRVMGTSGCTYFSAGRRKENLSAGLSLEELQEKYSALTAPAKPEKQEKPAAENSQAPWWKFCNQITKKVFRCLNILYLPFSFSRCHSLQPSTGE